MAKTYQVMNVCDHGHNKVVEYQDFQSILWHLLQAEYGVR